MDTTGEKKKVKNNILPLNFRMSGSARLLKTSATPERFMFLQIKRAKNNFNCTKSKRESRGRIDAKRPSPFGSVIHKSVELRSCAPREQRNS